MRGATWKRIALPAILMALIETMILQIVANVLAKQDILMMEMKFVLSAIILGLFFYIKGKYLKVWNVSGTLIN